MILGADAVVEVVAPEQPVFKMVLPESSTTIVVPVPGPRGLAGAGSTNDEAVAEFINDPTSLSHIAVVDVVTDETEPPVNLTILFENALA